MTYETLVSLLEDVVTSHKVGLSYFNGLEKDFKSNADNAYPAIHVVPLQNPITISTNERASQTWTIIMEYHEILPDDKTTAQINEALDRGNKIIKDLVFKIADIGSSNTTLTYNDVVTKFDYSIPVPVNPTTFVGSAPDNTTGWQVTFTLQDDNRVDFCCTEERFNPLSGI